MASVALPEKLIYFVLRHFRYGVNFTEFFKLTLGLLQVELLDLPFLLKWFLLCNKKGSI
jgi:hypothetical protein